MRKKLFAGIISFAIAISMLNGCGINKTTANKEENFSVVDTMRMQVKNEGIFYLDGYTQRMMFYDFNLAESIPICDRPNCEHNSSECNAYLSQGYMSGMGCYQDRLYYYDNTDPKLPFYQCDKNGSNRRVILYLNESGKYKNLSVSLPMFFVEDSIFFALTSVDFLSEPITKDDGTLIDQEYSFMIGKIDLVKEEFEIVKEPEQFDNSTEWITVLDYIGGKLVYSRNGNHKCTQHIYDLETGTDDIIRETDENNLSYLGAIHDIEKAFYVKDYSNKSDIYAVDMQTKDKESVFQKNLAEKKEIYWTMTGENLYYCIYEEGMGPNNGEEFGIYNLKSGEERTLSKEEYCYAPFIAETEEWYVGQTEDGKICIKKEDYNKKDWNKVQVIGSF